MRENEIGVPQESYGYPPNLQELDGNPRAGKNIQDSVCAAHHQAPPCCSLLDGNAQLVTGRCPATPHLEIPFLKLSLTPPPPNPRSPPQSPAPTPAPPPAPARDVGLQLPPHACFNSGHLSQPSSLIPHRTPRSRAPTVHLVRCACDCIHYICTCVCVCVYVCVCACMCVYVRVCACFYVHTYIHAYIHHSLSRSVSLSLSLCLSLCLSLPLTLTLLSLT